MLKRMLSLMLALVLLSAAALPVSAHEVPDFDRLGSITITMTYQEERVPGGSLTLYRVADVVSDNGDYLFAYTADFAECAIPVTELNSADLPEALADIAGTNNLEGTTLTIDQNGKATFSELSIGLYLLVQDEAAPGFKRIAPFLVSVPYHDDGTYIYNVSTAPKNLPGLEEEPTVPPTEPSEPSDPTEPTEPDEPKLPQTGQTNWPIPVMAVAGMLLITAGFCLSVSGKKKHDEA